MTPDGIRITHPDKLFIDGQWVRPARGGAIEITSPNSEEVIARVAEASSEDMDAAVAAARRAFDNGGWTGLTPAERGAFVRRWAAIFWASAWANSRPRGRRRLVAWPASPRSCTAGAWRRSIS